MIGGSDLITKVFVVDSEAHAAGRLAIALRQRGYTAEAVASGRTCLERVVASDAAVVLSDVVTQDMSGIELCEQLRLRAPRVLPIILTSQRDTELAVSAMRAGAFDFLTNPVSIPALELALIRAVGELSVACELGRLRDAPSMATDLTLASPAIQRTFELVRRVAHADATVLVTGESGTGKERVAAEIHHASPRREEPFVAIDCSAMTVPLLESELFGHVRGAFTGAHRDRVGLFLRAGRGTILLDELAEMPLEMQAKLLRVLQQRSVRPLGADEELPVYARIIAATNRDLDAEVAAGRFRKDLYHRINVVSVQVPPLRSRREDILPLTYGMLRKCVARIGKPVTGMTVPAARMLLEYDWPGNVRELENCIERAVAVCQLDLITIDDLPEKLRYACGAQAFDSRGSDGFVTLAEMKLSYVRTALALCRGNKSRAARLLAIDRRTISSVLAAAKPHAAALVSWTD